MKDCSECAQFLFCDPTDEDKEKRINPKHRDCFTSLSVEQENRMKWDALKQKSMDTGINIFDMV